MEQNAGREKLLRKIESLKADLEDRKLSLPAHSIRPHQLLAIEELENEVRKLEIEVRIIDSDTGSKDGI